MDAEDVDLELVTVDDLQLALQAADKETLDSIRDIADSPDDGLIARNRESGEFTVVSDAEILALQEQSDASLADMLGQQSVNDGDDGTQSTLLSTQMFRKLVDAD